MGLIFLRVSFKIQGDRALVPAAKQGGYDMDMKKRILVVDDDNMNLARTRIILGKEYDVFLADSGIGALEKLRSEKADMVLLDIDMPGMNGIETFERMKEFAADVPVIFLTASGLEEDVQNAIKLGAVNYLKKPYRPEELLRRVALEFEKA
jgi:CheY-like chemotaxis protein